LARDLQDRWQRSVESKVLRLLRELVFEPLEPQDIKSREVRGHECLSAIRS